MSDATKSILMNSEIIAVDQDPDADPVQTLSSTGSLQVLWRRMKDGLLVVGIFNRGGVSVPGGFKWSSLPISSPGKALQARDLWKHAPVAISGDTFEANIPPHRVTMLQISVKR